MTGNRRNMYFLSRLALGLLLLFFTAPSSIMGQENYKQAGTNMLGSLSNENLGEFSWMNKPEQYILSKGKLTIRAEKGTDFFINPEDKTSVATAPLLFREIQGDFVAITKVEPKFNAVWNACSLMVFVDEDNWIKFAFENSDATGPSIVSVVTRGVSDDANGPILNDKPAIWLKLIRKGDIYAMHWSTDAINYNLARLAAMPFKKTVKIGMEAQCPDNGPAEHVFSHFSLKNMTVGDLRKGN